MHVVASDTDSLGHFNITVNAHKLLGVLYRAYGPIEGRPLLQSVRERIVVLPALFSGLLKCAPMSLDLPNSPNLGKNFSLFLQFSINALSSAFVPLFDPSGFTPPHLQPAPCSLDVKCSTQSLHTSIKVWFWFLTLVKVWWWWFRSCCNLFSSHIPPPRFLHPQSSNNLLKLCNFVVESGFDLV